MFCRFVQLVLDTDAVIADRGVAVGAGGGEIGELPAQAIAQRPHLAGAARRPRAEGDGGLDVLDALGDVETLHQAEGLLPFRVGLVGQLHARLEAARTGPGTRAKKPRDANPSAMSRITWLTPKISWITTMPGPRPEAGLAR